MMKYNYITYIWPLVASACITLFIGIYTIVRQKYSRCANTFFVSMLLVTIWSGGNALEMSGANLDSKLFWANVQYIAYCFSPLALLALCMRFTGYDKWLKVKYFGWLLLIPTVILLLVWTNEYHGLIRYDIRLDTNGAFPVISKKYGYAFYVHAAYEYLINISALIMLILASIYKKSVYRKQTVILLIGAALIIFPNMFYVLGFSPVKGFDLTPVFFAPAGILMLWAIFRYKMFDLVPLARTTIIEHINTGVLVLDLQNRILDMNIAFRDITGIPMKKAAGANAEIILLNIPELQKSIHTEFESQCEFSLKMPDIIRTYNAVISPISDNNGRIAGKTVVVYDITEKKQAERIYITQQQKIASEREKEKIARDLHDNLGQVLGFINLQAQGIEHELESVGITIVSDKLAKLSNAAREAHEELRGYIRNIMNSSDANIDFNQTINSILDNFEERSEIKTQREIFLNKKVITIKQGTEIQLINIIKEIFNNIEKHSEADLVKFSLQYKKDNVLFIKVTDNGKGFRCDSKKSDTFGIKIMKQRAEEIGAELEIASSLGNGCEITIRLPIQEPNKSYLC